MLRIINPVPCNGCTLCCHGDAVRLLPHEDPSLYKTEPFPYDLRYRMLAHKPNGHCIYLEEKGCSIHETKPQICREMDCRKVAKNITYTQARKASKKGLLKMQVWTHGRKLDRETR